MEDNKWFNYNETECVKQVYGKYTIKQFWDFWSSKQRKVMEVRIQNFPLIKETAAKFSIPHSSSGVYVNNYQLLKNVIAYTREKATVWFGIQPRKLNWNKRGWKSYGSGDKGGSSDENVEEISFIFIDIDRTLKGGIASNAELECCDILFNKILNKLSKEDWNKGYCKVCSGHGVQGIIKLDIPIRMPNIPFDNETKCFIKTLEFEKIKNIIKKGIGAEIRKYANKLKDDLNVEIDATCFRIAQVGALPFTYNFKYNTKKWRGIVELKDEINDGLSDYIMSKESNIKEFRSHNVFIQRSHALTNKNRLKKGKLHENELIKFMLENNFPHGEINNTLWFMLKCLIRDSKINVNSQEFIKIHNQLKQKHSRTFTLNIPEDRFVFDENIVNAYCINNLFPPVYEVWPNRTKRLKYNIDITQTFYDFYKTEVLEEMKLNEDSTIQDDIRFCKNNLIELSGYFEGNKRIAPKLEYIKGFNQNQYTIFMFINACYKKYGKEKTEYYIKYLFDRGLNWQ